MIRSMTGFGRSSFRMGGHTFDIEARSVNHRFLDIRVRLPKLMVALDGELRERIQRRFARGKVEIGVTVSEAGNALAPRLEVDLEAATQYARAAAQLRETEGLGGSLDVGTVLGLPGVARFVETELPAGEVQQALGSAVDAALEALDAMRVTEGDAIDRDLRSRLDRISVLADELEQRVDSVQQAARARLRKRAEQLAQETGLFDEARLHQEIVIAADRMDVTEEIVRLRSHVVQFRDVVAGGEAGTPVGRRLDFLLQELGREANTIGSKGSDAPIAHTVVELKAEIERIREQVQNVE
jgi:uncharacterized protein (TIGR00255 family)